MEVRSIPPRVTGMGAGRPASSSARAASLISINSRRKSSAVWGRFAGFSPALA